MTSLLVTMAHTCAYINVSGTDTGEGTKVAKTSCRVEGYSRGGKWKEIPTKEGVSVLSNLIWQEPGIYA